MTGLPPTDPPEPPLPPEHPADFGDDGPPTPVALVSTVDPVAIQVGEVDDERIPDGMVCMGAFLAGRLIARSIVPPEMLADLSNRNVFQDPVRIALAAVERDPGLQCRLFALLPADQVEEDDEDEEPWAASVPKFEDVVADEEQEEAEEEEDDESEDEERVYPLLLGNIVRFRRDRKHPDDLAAEAADVLQTIIADERPLSNIVDKLLDDLLD
jgi:hypothetical protein